MKKLLAMVLALVMTLSLATVSSNAAFKDADKVDETYAEAVEVLNGLKVFQGYEDGSFNPTGNITRAEVAAIVYRVYTTDVKDTYVKNYETYNKFSDMSGAGWAKGYIGYCANAEFVKGYPDGTFQPSGNVTGYEVLAMILRAVGYDKNGEFTGADWALHVAQIAEQNKILTNVKGIDLNKAATREVVAELLFQAIQIPMVTYTAAFGYQNVSLSAEKDSSLVNNKTLADAFNLNCYDGYVTADGVGSKYDGMILTDKMGTTEVKDDVTIDVDDQDIFDAGRYGHVWTVKTTAITDVIYDDTLLATKYENWSNDWTNKNKTDFIAKEGNMKYFVNGAEVKKDAVVLVGTSTAPAVVGAINTKGAEKALYDIDGDGDIDTVIIVNPTVDKMEADYTVKGDNVKIKGKTFDKDDVSGYEELAKGDVFTYVDMADGVRYFEELTAIEGQKTKFTTPKSGAAYITFGGKDYEESKLAGTTQETVDGTTGHDLFSTVKATFDVDAVIYLDRGGYVAYSAFPASATKYAMVIDSYKVLNDKHTGYDYYAKLLLTDGTETEYVAVNNSKSNLTIGYVASKNEKTPSTVGDYDNLGTLVLYSVKDDVYTLTTTGTLERGSVDGSSGTDKYLTKWWGLTDAYKAGAATMKIGQSTNSGSTEYKWTMGDGTPYAVVSSSAVFYYWIDENTHSTTKTVHYGVNVGRYDKDDNAEGVPSYSANTIDGTANTTSDLKKYGTEVKYLVPGEDSEIKAAVLSGMQIASYDNYAYIYKCTKETTTGASAKVYTFLGVDSDGNKVEFQAYKSGSEMTASDYEGKIVSYFERQDGYYDFGVVEGDKYSITCVGGDAKTVKFREEGTGTNEVLFSNLGKIYDVTDTSALTDEGNTYDFLGSYSKQVQALVVKEQNATTGEWEIVCAYVLKDNLTYGEIKINCSDPNANKTYWKPVKSGNDTVYYSLSELDSVWSGNTYHIGNSETTTTVDAKVFTKDTYTLTKHVAMTYTVKAVTGITGASAAVKDNEGNYTITVPYTTDFSGKQGSDLVNIVYNGTTGGIKEYTRTVTSHETDELNEHSDDVGVKVVLTSTDTKCTETFNVTFVKAAPVYTLTLAQDGTTKTQLTATLSADLKLDGIRIGLYKLVSGEESIVGTTTALSNVPSATENFTIGEPGDYRVKVFAGDGRVLRETEWVHITAIA